MTEIAVPIAASIFGDRSPDPGLGMIDSKAPDDEGPGSRGALRSLWETLSLALAEVHTFVPGGPGWSSN